MRKLLILFTVALPLGFGAQSALAEDKGHDQHVEKMVVALKTDDLDLAETDISHLGVGDAETIYTEDGRTIDILRQENGVEIYIDGELVDLGGTGLHEEHRSIHQHEEGHATKVIVIREEVEID